MDELLGKTLLEGGALVVLVVFVIFWMRELRADRKEEREERSILLKAMSDVQIADKAKAQQNMEIGMTSVREINGSIRDLIAVNIELSKALAVHDMATRSQYEIQANDMRQVLAKLQAIEAQLHQQ